LFSEPENTLKCLRFFLENAMPSKLEESGENGGKFNHFTKFFGAVGIEIC
jgi:hypothetical protein